MKKNLAFTLAETLIVIAIIGVVAALTLPNLNSSTADKEIVTKVKKINAGLTDAYDRAVVVYGPMDGWFNGLSTAAERSERAKNRITEFMKVSKDCNMDEGCWSTGALKHLDGADIYEDFRDELAGMGAHFVNLADGTSLAFRYDDPGLIIYVDIDGANKGKTKIGSDIFIFSNIAQILSKLTNDLIPDGLLSEDLTGDFLPDYMTSWVLNNDNADYLKADCSSGSACVCPDGEKLNWEDKTSCN